MVKLQKKHCNLQKIALGIRTDGATVKETLQKIARGYELIVHLYKETLLSSAEDSTGIRAHGTRTTDCILTWLQQCYRPLFKR